MSFPRCRYVLFNDTDTFKIQLALAGYSKKDVEVYHDRQYKALIVKTVDGYVPPVWHENNSAALLHHDGIAFRSFTSEYALPTNAQIDEVVFEDGLLTVRGAVVVPEEHKRLKLEFAKQEPRSLLVE